MGLILTKPASLVPYEKTAHLDVAKERRVKERLRQLKIMRISVAQRPEVMNGADTLRIGGDLEAEPAAQAETPGPD